MHPHSIQANMLTLKIDLCMDVLQILAHIVQKSYLFSHFTSIWNLKDMECNEHCNFAEVQDGIVFEFMNQTLL